MKKRMSVMLSALLALALAACGANPSAATSAPATADPCTGEALQASVQAVHDLMREFDDAASLASVTPRDQLPGVITELQRIRRTAQDQPVPSCLKNLKTLQLNHMTMVIDTLLAFLGGADTNALNQGIARSRQLHDLYTMELARVLGVTVIPPTQFAQPAPTETAASPAVQVTNPGPAPVNMRAEPALTAANVGLLEVGVTATALGRTNDGTWIQIEVPNQPGARAWVYSPLVQLSAPVDALPVTYP